MRKLLFFLALISSTMSQAQAGYLDVDAGADVTGDCGQDQNLSATYNDVKETTAYVVESTPYAPPADFTTGTTVPGLAIDDRWSDVIEIGFTFCYYGNTYTQLVVGSNAEISFNTAYSGGFNEYDLSDGGIPYTLPQPNDDYLAFNTIFGPGHDIYPSSDPVDGTIVYELIGTAPQRALVIKYDNIRQFSCTTLRSTSMIVLYETSNNIDVFIKEKPVCSDWNDGYALVGINNADGTQSVTPPGRNTSVWDVSTANSEAWRFIPDGASVTTFAWTDPNGVVQGTTADITVSPPTTTIYTATATYTNCNGDIVTMSDDVEVFTGPVVDLGVDTVLCDTASMVLDATPSNAANFTTITYLWSTGETTPTITATSSGTYSVTVTGTGGCMGTATDEIVLGFGITPVITFPDAPYYLCHSVSSVTNDPVTVTAATVGQDASQFTYAWTEAGNSTILSDTAALDVTEPGTYTVVVTGGSCSATETVTVDYYSNEFCVYPQGISPNNDQLNDRFDLEWLNDMKGIKNIKIFNRYGTLVYDKNDYTNEFEGVSDNDYDLPTGTYFYVLSLADDTVKEGYLYINR